MKILDCHLVALSIKDQGTVITLFILEQMTSKFTAFDDLARELDSGCLCLWQYSFLFGHNSEVILELEIIPDT